MKKKREQGRPNMKNTDNLQQELMEAPTLDQFLSENQDNFTRESVCRGNTEEEAMSCWKSL